MIITIAYIASEKASTLEEAFSDRDDVTDITDLNIQLNMKMAIPFAPFLALGAILALFAGQPVIHAYLHHL